MKPLVIHHGSALAGAAVLGLLLFGISAAQESSDRQSSSQTTFTPVFSNAPTPVRITNMPTEFRQFDPLNAVVIREDDGPYVVPPGKVFVLTGFGGYGQQVSTLWVDGVQELQVNANSTRDSVVPVPPGFTVRANSSILLQDEYPATPPGVGRAWGYLVDAQGT